jgi:hypothetical protein
VARQDGGVSADPVLFPLGQLGSDVVYTVAITPGDHGGHSLHQVVEVDPFDGIGKIPKGMRVRVNKSRSYVVPRGIDDPAGRDIFQGRITDEGDAVIPNTNVYPVCFQAFPVQYGTSRQ